MSANGGVRDAEGFFVFTGGGFEWHEAHVVPEEVRVNLVADDPAPDAPVLGMRTAPALGKFADDGIEETVCRIHGTDREFVVFAMARMQDHGIDGRVLGRIGNDDEIDDDARVRERFDLCIQ